MRQMPRRLGPGLVLLLLGGAAPACYGQEAPAARPLFADDAPLRLTLEGPLRTLFRSRRDREELDSLIRYQDAAGSSVTLDVQIRTRGNSRLDVCTFPPLRLDFRRQQVTGTIFAGQNQLKLVVLCKDLADYRDYLTLEFELYRVFNALTSTSYRVRWVDVEYVDTDRRDDAPQHRSAFLIEEDSEVAERVGMQTWNVETVDLNTYAPDAMALLSLFQYMIGNTDWSGTSARPGERCCHNGDVLRDSNGLAVLLPYDFDQSGFVNASYASPAAGLPIRSVRQRLYRGYCAHNDALGGAYARFNAAREQIESLLAAAAIRDNTRRRVLRYIEDFYATIGDERASAESIVAACRG